jgi:hypothetical protein
LKIFLNLDGEKQPYLLGYIFCSQLKEPQQITLYLDTGSNVTTLLDIDVVKLGLKWRGLKQTECTTAVGTAYPYVMRNAIVFLRDVEKDKTSYIPFKLKQIHLMPPDDPLSIVPVQYDFGFSLLGLDVLQKFSTIKMNWADKNFSLEG